MAQGDVSFMRKMVESLVVKIDHVKYEEFLSSDSKSSRVARQYHRISSEIRSQVSLDTSPKMACANMAVSINVSHETR